MGEVERGDALPTRPREKGSKVGAIRAQRVAREVADATKHCQIVLDRGLEAALGVVASEGLGHLLAHGSLGQRSSGRPER